MLSIAPALVLLAAVQVSSNGGCLDGAAVTITLENTLAAASGDRRAELAVDVTSVPAAPGWHAVSLTAATQREGEVLARRFSLAEADCAQGTELLDAVLSRFLDGFPRERWTAAPITTPAPTPRPRRRLGIAPRGGADLGLLPSSADPLIADTSGDFEIAIAPDRSGPSGELLLRQGTWSDVGKGRYQPVTFLAGAGWAWVRENSATRTGLRSGVLAIRGDRNAEPISEKFLPWVEVYGDVAWRAGPVRIGPQVALSLLRVNAETKGGAARRVVPTNRIGLRVEIPL